MNKTLAAVLAAALLAPSSVALGQVSINIQLPLPPRPPLVVVSPGIQVVEDFADEVFFHSGFYWMRRENRWYRAQSPQRSFTPVETKVVPVVLAKTPPGHYRHWKKHKAEEKRERREEKREEKHEKKHHKKR